MSHAASRARLLGLALIFALFTFTGAASALVYEDLDVIYAENFDDDTSMSGLVPQVDAYGAGRLHEGDIGNGPFVPLSLESAPAVPRGAAQASVGTTFFPGFPFEAKVLSYDANVAPPIPGTGSLGVRGTFGNLSTVTNGAHVMHVTVVATASANPLETNRASATLTIAGLGGPGGTSGFLSANDGLAPPAPAALVLLSPAVTAALLGGAPFQLTLLVDRDAEIATAELVVGASVVTAGPHALAVVTPGVDLAYHGQALVVNNIDPYTAGNLTPGPDDATIDFDSFEVRGTPPAPDADGDGIPDASDACPFDAQNDADGDGVCGDVDTCPGGDDNVDTDDDGVADFCDACPNDPANDADGDGFCADVDTCPGADDNLNADGDALPDACDVCPHDAANDADGDGVCADVDNCPLVANDNQADQDGDDAGDACDPDIDGDGDLNDADNCPFDANPDQADSDGDGAGDVCDDDLDGDGVLDADDACLPSPLGEAVNADGCAISELCPCAHPQGQDRWKNHGAYVSCVAHAANDFLAAGLITAEEHGAIVSAAGQSSCGHKN